MESVDNREIKTSRRSRKVKNLEEEVEFIFSQDESDEEFKENIEELLPKTPTRRNTVKDVTTPSTSQAPLQDMLQTPRRSCRKSIKPTQEYEDIVNKSLRSCTRSSKKHLLVTEEETVENEEDSHEAVRWTPAKVGRVSQKRNRKSRRNTKGKKKEDKEHDKTIQEVENVTVDKDNQDLEKQNVPRSEDVVEIKVKSKGKKKENKEKDSETAQEIGNTEVNKENDDFDDVVEFKEKSKKDLAEQIEIKGNLRNDLKEQNVHPMEDLAEFVGEHTNKSKLNALENKAASTTNCEKNIELLEELEHNNDMTDKLQIKIEDNEEINDAITTEEEIDANDVSINLIQEDSEDCKEFVQTSEEDSICIVYENNISNKEIKIERQDSAQSEDNNDSFGCYLKSNQINISDLGLNPLKEEEEDKDAMELNFEIQECEEMPSLIVCDDEDEVEEIAKEIKNNDTFDANDSVTLLKEEEDCSAKPNEVYMETLQLSDDETQTPKKLPHVIINESGKSTPKASVFRSKIPCTPKANASTLPSNPKQTTKAFRFPTPYRSRQKAENEMKENMMGNSPNKNPINASMISLTTLKPKDIILRGIRKRSLSVCIDGSEEKCLKLLAGPLARVKQDRMVKFYSPANQTTIIDDLDMAIAKSVKKQKSQEHKEQFVTTRRKRSMSLDESIMTTSMISKLPRPVVTQNSNIKAQTSTSSSKLLSRTKLPNFAAIHQKQFQKMENLVDHVSRKQERSKILITSASKLKPASAQKNVSIVKNSKNIASEKPKALKKIDLGNTSQLSRSILNTTSTLKMAPNKLLDVSVTKPNMNLPDPRFALTKPIPKSTTIPQRQPQQQSINKYLKPSQTTNIEKSRVNAKTVPSKPTFNLSTSLMTQPSTSQKAKKADTSLLSSEDKMAARLQRHMDLFKGRVPATRAGVASRKNEVILKGVRSNRRFELQMQHRKNLEQ